MERKTAEELKQIIGFAIMNHNNPVATDIIIQTIQMHTQEENERVAVEFKHWLDENERNYSAAASELYQIFKQQTGGK